MIFTPTSVDGAFLVDLEKLEDERGYFARSFCEAELAQRGLVARFVQQGVSFNRAAGTLRGMHWQAAPHGETKLVRCTRGAIHDVVLDVRPGSPTYRRWFGARLDEDGGRALYVPEGCAHGFLTLAPGSEVLYLMSAAHAPGSERGVRWDDPAFGIEWPVVPALTISERDRSHPPHVVGT